MRGMWLQLKNPAGIMREISPLAPFLVLLIVLSGPIAFVVLRLAAASSIGPVALDPVFGFPIRCLSLHRGLHSLWLAYPDFGDA